MENFEKLFYWHGIASHYYNYKGDFVEVPFDNKLNILAAKGVDTSNPEDTAKEAFLLDVAPWQKWLPSCNLVYVAAEQSFFVNLAPEELELEFSYALVHDNSPLVEGRFIGSQMPEIGDYLFEGVRDSRRAVAISPIVLGYHQLTVTQGSQSQTSLLIVAPSKAYLSPDLAAQKTPWGIILQLYTLRSKRNWGIGDFSDLAYVITQASALGVDIIGLNPLHALIDPVAENCSPYSPSDRRFINPLYIDLEIEPEFSFDLKPITEELNALRNAENVPYAAVHKLKTIYFRQMFSLFEQHQINGKTDRARDFLNYVEAQGEALEAFCIYQVRAELGKPYQGFPQEEKIKLLRTHAVRIQFHAYLQWVAHRQLNTCQELAKQQGMDIGLMRDLAVGANGGGAEVNTNLDLFCREAAVGAPPDPLAEKGQNWGLPPMDPAALRLSNFAHYIDLLRRNMSHAGALRIDHAMSLMRLWWCPPGKTADFGAYVYYPFHEMMGLLKLESVLNECVIVGEDMGVVPPEFRAALYDGDIFTNKLFYFEKNHAGQFKHPNDYEPHSLAMLTNHDVPTLASWWSTSDLIMRRDLNLFEEGVDFAGLLAMRRQEKLGLLHWLKGLDINLNEDLDALINAPLDHDLCAAILRGASRCKSQLFVVQLEDLELMEKPVNVPGTWWQYPNWQRKLTVTIEDLFADAKVKDLMAEINAVRA